MRRYWTLDIRRAGRISARLRDLRPLVHPVGADGNMAARDDLALPSGSNRMVNFPAGLVAHHEHAGGTRDQTNHNRSHRWHAVSDCSVWSLGRRDYLRLYRGVHRTGATGGWIWINRRME